MSSATTRIFVAVEIGDATRCRAESLCGELRVDGVRVGWVTPENMHLTLKYLGDIAAGSLETIFGIAAEVAARHAVFAFQLRGAGAFPHPGRPRVVWLGAAEGQQPLAELAEDLDRSLAAAGFPREPRPYHPHLTLGRVREGGGVALARLGDCIRAQEAFDAGSSVVRELVVFESVLGRAGPQYLALHRAPLAADRETRSGND